MDIKVREGDKGQTECETERETETTKEKKN